MKVTTNIPAGTEILVKARTVSAGLDFIGRIPVKIGSYIYWVEPALIVEVVPSQEEPEPAKLSNRDIIQNAIDDGYAVEFTYQKEDGTIEHRAIDPESLFTSRRGQELVGGYDLDEVYGDSYRAFRLDRIQGEVEIN